MATGRHQCQCFKIIVHRGIGKAICQSLCAPRFHIYCVIILLRCHTRSISFSFFLLFSFSTKLQGQPSITGYFDHRVILTKLDISTNKDCLTEEAPIARKLDNREKISTSQDQFGQCPNRQHAFRKGASLSKQPTAIKMSFFFYNHNNIWTLHNSQPSAHGAVWAVRWPCGILAIAVKTLSRGKIIFLRLFFKI